MDPICIILKRRTLIFAVFLDSVFRIEVSENLVRLKLSITSRLGCDDWYRYGRKVINFHRLLTKVVSSKQSQTE